MITSGEIGAIVAIILNLASLVYGAGKIKGASDAVQKIVEGLEKTIDDHEKRLSFLEGVHSVQQNLSRRS